MVRRPRIVMGVDLRLADDLLLVSSTRSAGLELLDALISELSLAGLILNDDETKVITNEAQAPSSITRVASTTVQVLDRDEAH